MRHSSAVPMWQLFDDDDGDGGEGRADGATVSSAPSSSSSGGRGGGARATTRRGEVASAHSYFSSARAMSCLLLLHVWFFVSNSHCNAYNVYVFL